MSYFGANDHHYPPNEGQFMMMGNRQSVNSAETVDDPNDIEVVKVQPREVAPINETSENSLHRALNANQVCII
jgi:hypothetical protein